MALENVDKHASQSIPSQKAVYNANQNNEDFSKAVIAHLGLFQGQFEAVKQVRMALVEPNATPKFQMGAANA